MSVLTPDAQDTERELLVKILRSINGGGPVGFTSALTVITAGQPINAAHNLGYTPRFVRSVIVCVANDAATGLLAGDEIDGDSVFDSNLGSQWLSVGANGTHAWLSCTTTAEASLTFVVRAGGATANPTSINNFRVRLYAY